MAYTISSAQFVKGAVDPSGAPADLKPHVAFIGRSNVGKSSFLNSLVSRKDLARSSSKPGKTTEINFFQVNGKMYFVDLPGYGYAKQSKAVRDEIMRMINDYLFDELMPIKKVVMLVDSSVGATEHDMHMFEELLHVIAMKDVLIIANKIDKLKKNDIKPTLSRLSDVFQGAKVISYSAKKHLGKSEVLRELLS